STPWCGDWKQQDRPIPLPTKARMGSEARRTSRTGDVGNCLACHAWRLDRSRRPRFVLTLDIKQNIISYMKRDSRLSSILHALLHMAEQDGPVTSETRAQCLGTNPVGVRRTMRYLREAGIVTSERGHAGGWRILAALGTVTLRQLHEAL